MKKMALIAHHSNRDALLKALQALGAVEVISASLEGTQAAAAPATLAALEARLTSVRAALDAIRLYNDEKSSFLAPKPEISHHKLASAPSLLDESEEIIADIKQLSTDINALKARRQRLRARIAQLEPYVDFDTPLETLGESAQTASLLGDLPDEQLANYEQITKDFDDTAYFESSPLGKGTFSVYVLMHKSVQERLTGELKFIGFAEAPVKDDIGTAADIVYDLNSELESLEREETEYKEKFQKIAVHKETLCVLEDYLWTEIARERCLEQLGETGVAFALEGWVIAKEQERIEKAVLETAPEAYLSFKDPKDGELPPTALSNPRTVTPFEAVTNMYAVPSSKGFDPNKLMAIFYFLIFGMMMADLAYGLILTFGALALLRIKKPTGMFRQITTVIMICGISAALWGLFFGNIFGIEGMPYVINPLQDAQGAITTMILCFGIGVVHIFTGLFIGMYMDIRRGHFWDAIFDRFSWVLVIGGSIMLIIGGTVGSVGGYLALAGVAILLFTQGRHKKGIFKKAAGGLSSVYGVTGYISDILSYCRIFGMGLATTVIAMVFNTIAGLLFDSPILFIFGLVVLTVGHVFNIAINTLGAFVHTARLQYIEFFGKFYEGDGRTFMPLTYRAHHHRITD